jgi:hypothetical protein
MTIKALLPSPRYTGHDATYSVLRNIRNRLMNCIFKAVNVREGVSKNLSFQIPPLKMQFVRRLQMLRRTFYVASWPVYVGDGSNALIVMENIS